MEMKVQSEGIKNQKNMHEKALHIKEKRGYIYYRSTGCSGNF